MRIRIMQKPTVSSIDGIQLGRLVVGRVYDVSELLGAVLIAEGWARLARSEPAIVIPLSELGKLILPPAPIATAADRPRRPRHRKKR